MAPLPLNYFAIHIPETSDKQTSLRAYDHFCIKPKKGGCNAPEGTLLTYGKVSDNGQCPDDDMQFLYDDVSGVLKHQCSGMFVCPQEAQLGSRILLSKTCGENEAKFTRLLGTTALYTV